MAQKIFSKNNYLKLRISNSFGLKNKQGKIQGHFLVLELEISFRLTIIIGRIKRALKKLTEKVPEKSSPF